MKPTPLAGLAMAASLLAIAAPAFAFSANSNNTIAIQHVEFNGSSPDVNGLADFRVSFKNDGSVAADRVEFVLDTPEGYSTRLEDVGRFAPGATITHDARVPYLGGLQAPNEATMVRITKVDYVDGSVWSAPAKLQAAWQAAQPPAIPVGAYAL